MSIHEKDTLRSFCFRYPPSFFRISFPSSFHAPFFLHPFIFLHMLAIVARQCSHQHTQFGTLKLNVSHCVDEVSYSLFILFFIFLFFATGQRAAEYVTGPTQGDQDSQNTARCL